MKGKVVVITGATSGIGEIAAPRLARMGTRIALVARGAVRTRHVRRGWPVGERSFNFHRAPPIPKRRDMSQSGTDA